MSGWILEVGNKVKQNDRKQKKIRKESWRERRNNLPVTKPMAAFLNLVLNSRSGMMA